MARSECLPGGGKIIVTPLVCNDGYHFNMSMNLEIRQQQRCIQSTLRTDTLIQEVTSAFSPC